MRRWPPVVRAPRHVFLVVEVEFEAAGRLTVTARWQFLAKVGSVFRTPLPCGADGRACAPSPSVCSDEAGGQEGRSVGDAPASGWASVCTGLLPPRNLSFLSLRRPLSGWVLDTWVLHYRSGRLVCRGVPAVTVCAADSACSPCGDREPPCPPAEGGLPASSPGRCARSVVSGVGDRVLELGGARPPQAPSGQLRGEGPQTG